MMKCTISFLLFTLSFSYFSHAQSFYFGADQSYVNEMEDCGAAYKENGESKDVYQIFADHNCNLVRLRLWHTPSWYDQLNSGKRYSDFADIKKAIQRAKAYNMAVLLDFHLSDNWADPGKQLVPAAWSDVVDNLPVLQDSLYNYIYTTLDKLKADNLLPEMVQIGNETNKGILLSPEDNATWTLDWNRNAPLFNQAIKAVRDVSSDTQIMLHIADPKHVEWWMSEFTSNGVTDFDLIGISYYWAWHNETSVEGTGAVINRLKSSYPDKSIMIAETGYPWTTGFNDNANNINTGTAPGYSPPSPTNQRDWLIHLVQTVIDNQGSGVIYWEPSWVSTSCRTQWAQGSHYENVTFFDFDNNLLIPGGIEWMEYDYGLATNTSSNLKQKIKVFVYDKKLNIHISSSDFGQRYRYTLFDITGRIVQQDSMMNPSSMWDLSGVKSGIYLVKIENGNGESIVQKVSF